jgi:hypothetical protein
MTPLQFGTKPPASSRDVDTIISDGLSSLRTEIDRVNMYGHEPPSRESYTALLIDLVKDMDAILDHLDTLRLAHDDVTTELQDKLERAEKLAAKLTKHQSGL